MTAFRYGSREVKSHILYAVEADTNHSVYWKCLKLSALHSGRSGWSPSEGIKLLRVCSAPGFCHTVASELTFCFMPWYSITRVL